MMNIITVLRRAFAANPHQVPVGEREVALLTTRGIQQPTLQTYFVWRRSLMIFVVLATLASAGLATFREFTETEERHDLVLKMAERFHLTELLEEEMEEPEEEADEKTPIADPAAPLAQDTEASTASPDLFGQVTDAVELAALYVLPVAALAVVLLWTRFQLSHRIIVVAFTFSFLVPMIVGLCPWSWWGYVEPEFNPETQPLEYFQVKAEGVLEGIAYLVTLLPTVLSLVPGVQRACIRVKLLLPQAMLPGWFLVAASPFYALFLFVIFVAFNQFDTHPLFFVGMLIFLLAPLSYAIRADLFTRPSASDDDLRRIRNVQRWVGGLTALAGILLVVFLATREVMGVRLLGFHYENALLTPFDVAEFLLETISRSMFITVLGADLFMRMNVAAWKHAESFVGSPEAERYGCVMNEFTRVA